MAGGNKTQLITEMQFITNSGKALSEMEKIKKALLGVSEAYDKVAESAKKVTDEDKKAAKRPRNIVRTSEKGMSVSWAEGDKAGSRKANQLMREYNELLKQRLEYEERIKSLTATTRERNSITRAAEQATRAERLAFSRDKFYHPEKGALTQKPRYIIGRGIASFGSNLKGNGIAGRLIGDLTESLGKGLINPVAGAVSAISNVGKAFIDISKAAIEASAQIEMLKTNLSVVFGSETQSQKAFSDISQYAIKSPFGIEQTTEMAILLKQSGVYASDLMDTLKMIGDTAGGNAEKMKRIANNYAQIVSIGKASMLDMRQFAYAGIPIFEAVSKELNVSQARLRELISDGKVTSDIIKKVFQDLTGINGLFENATEKGAKTLKARLQNLKDAKQLALASVGNSILSIGESYGGDSYALQAVGFAEALYQKLERWTSIKNIEKAVTVIGNRDEKIYELQELIAFNKVIGDDKTATLLQDSLNEILKLSSKDSERAVYAQQYHNNMDAYNNLEKSLKDLPLEMAQSQKQAELTDLNKKLSLYSMALYKKRGGATGGYSIGDELTGLSESDLNNYVESYKAAIEKTSSDIEALGTAANVNAQQLNAYREELLINRQQTASDVLDANRVRSGSAYTALSEIKQEYAKTAEAKAKEDAKRKERWDKALKLLREVSKHTDDKGLFNFEDVSFSQLGKYLKEGILTEERKLQVVEGNRALTDFDDLNKLRKQFTLVKNLILPELNKSGLDKTILRDFEKATRKEVLGNNEKFFENLGYINDLLEKITESLPKDFAEQIKLMFGASTLVLGVDKSPLSMNLDASIADEFIPLWKRILGSAFNITPNAITSTQGAFDTYTKDLALRNRIGNVYYAGLKSGELSYDDIQRMNVMRAANTTLPNGGLTYQTNIQATDANAGKWGGKAWRSVEVFDANMSSIKEAIDTLDKLMSSGILTPESQGVTSSKVITAEDLLKDTDLTGEMLVTAFGEKFIHAKTGEQLSVKNGKFYDTSGTEVANKDAIIQGDIYRDAKEAKEIFQKEYDKLELTKPFNSLLDNLKNIGKDLAKDAFNAPLELVGKNLGHIIAGYETWDNYNKDLAGSMKQIVAGSLQQIGPAMTTAGFQIAGSAALQRNWGMVAAGLAIAGAGGIVNGIGVGMMENPESERDKSDEDYKKAQQLKDQLADLLEQARSDALYYEQNLRHKTALGINKEFSLKSVNDAIISPSGDVITTHPDDYLIATKTPQALGSPNITVQPKISFKVENKAGSNINVRQEERQTNDGSIEVVAVIEQVVSDYISSSRSDDAFMAREARGYGVRSIM